MRNVVRLTFWLTVALAAGAAAPVWPAYGVVGVDTSRASAARAAVRPGGPSGLPDLGTVGPADRQEDGPVAQSRKVFYVYNLTNDQLTLAGYRHYPSPGDTYPSIAATLDPGMYHEFFISQESDPVQPMYVDVSAGATYFYPRLKNGANTYSTECSTENASGHKMDCRPTNKKDEQNVVLILDDVGTTVSVPIEKQDVQNNMLEGVCGSGLGDCDFDATKWLSDPKKVPGGTYGVPYIPEDFSIIVNNSQDSIEYRNYLTTTTSTTETWTVTSMTQAKLTDIVTQEVEASFSQAITETTTFTQEVHLTIQPGYEGWFEYIGPTDEYLGNWMLSPGNDTKIILEDAKIVYPKEEGQKKFVGVTQPVSGKSSARTDPSRSDLVEPRRERGAAARPR